MIEYHNYFYIDKKTGRKIYAGLTEHRSKRNSRHRYCCNTPGAKGYNYPLYRYMREHGGFDAFEMVTFATSTDYHVCELIERTIIKEISPICNVIHNRGKKK